MVPIFFGKDRIHGKRAIWFQMKPDSPYYVLSGSKNLALFLALLRWYEIKLSNMRWREICITFPCYGTDWHRKRQVKTPFCRFESCTAHQRKPLADTFGKGLFFCFRGCKHPLLHVGVDAPHRPGSWTTAAWPGVLCPRPPLSRTAADSFNVAFSYELIRYTVPQLIK